MIKTTLTAVTAAAFALGFAASTAFAQTAAPAATPAAPVTTKAPPAVKKAPAAKAATTTAKPKKVASACKGLPEAGCKGNTTCAWIVPTKANAKTGKVPASYCRVVAGVAKKAADKKASAAPTAPAAKKVVKAKAPAAATTAPKTQ